MIFLDKSREERVKDGRVQSVECWSRLQAELEGTQVPGSSGAQAGSRLPELRQVYPGGGGCRVS